MFDFGKLIEDGKKVLEQAAEAAGSVANTVSEATGGLVNAAGEAVNNVAGGASQLVEGATSNIMASLDQNGNGTLDIEDIIILALQQPYIKVNRVEFLTKELKDYISDEQLKVVINTNPYTAKVGSEVIEKIANSVIQKEINSVSGISAVLGLAGGLASIATVPTDIAQYYAYMLRTAQELMYLYGFPEIEVNVNTNQLNSSTINMLTVCLGAMFGVSQAATVIKVMAAKLAEGVHKKLLQKALTKGMVYPIVKKIASWFSVKMTKEIFAGFFKKAIPVVGGVISGGMTYYTFGQCCNRLQEELRNTPLVNKEYDLSEEEEIISAKFDEIIEQDEE